MDTLRIGIFGGTFDPIHNSHVQIALSVMKKYNLHKVIFVISYLPPHKKGQVQTSFTHRYKMVNIAVSKTKNFEASDIEKNLKGTSYTIRALKHFKKTYPDSQLYFIIGSDSLSELPTWRDLRGILEIAEIITYPRKNTPCWETPELLHTAGEEGIKKLKKGQLKAELFDISSTEIRSRLKSGKSVRKLVPYSVWKYLKENPRIYK
ncbi:MAG: nicotinate-nucleotide adenylyltransferase [Planctomycetota bacterium]